MMNCTSYIEPYALHLLHCIVMLSAHAFAYSLGHAEPELEEPAEQAQDEDFANLVLDQGKPRCIN
jgi:hypothetical protein